MEQILLDGTYLLLRLKGQNLQIDMEGKGIADAQRLIITPLWNAFYFFCLYANAENISAKENYSSDNPLDIYVIENQRIN